MKLLLDFWIGEKNKKNLQNTGIAFLKGLYAVTSLAFKMNEIKKINFTYSSLCWPALI